MFNTLANTIETTVAEVATSEVAAETVKLGFTTENMRESLLCMGAGMIGIFIVVGCAASCSTSSARTMTTH